MAANGSHAEFATVICADHNMIAAACCALLSVRNNLSVTAPLMLVASDADANDVAAVESFKRRHDCEIELYHFDSRQLPKAPQHRWAPAAMTRVFLDQILPPDIQRLLYLDADTLVLQSLDPLRSLDLGPNWAAAVDDFIMAFPAKLDAQRRALGLRADSAYFNSGVILFDWARPETRQAVATARHNIETRADQYHATDQDALNAALDGKWLRLDPKWNVQTGFLPDIQRPAIVHFTGRRKPWRANASWVHRGYSDIYRSFLTGTAWEDVFPKPSVPRHVQAWAVHLGKRLEGLRKARRVRQYLESEYPYSIRSRKE
jgi:lipopolysaccharide biosynthesis glycosyltransferase